MATLPPRKNPTPTKICRQLLSPLEILLQMGLPKHRAEKALVATGHRDVQLASDWLLAHVSDTLLDVDSSREYVVYLCPVGLLYDQIQSFWREAFQKCGWNGAYNYSPDDFCESLVTILKEVFQTVLAATPLPTSLLLEKYISPNYMGLFLHEQQADILRKAANQFMKEVSPSYSRESSSKDLYLTLAYGYPMSHYSLLETFAANIDPSGPANWEVRLYSRDPRIIGCEVYKVLYSHVPREADELELLIGDFVYIQADSVATSPDGWVEGTSWLTGATGFLPINYIERTAESDAWTLHKAITILGNGDTDEVDGDVLVRRPPVSLSLLNLLENSEGSRRSAELMSDVSSLEKLCSRTLTQDNISQDIDALYAKVRKFKKIVPLYRFPIEGPRKIYIARHGERVDFTFGDWTRYCFDEKGKYLRKDLNMPERLPKRQGAPGSFFKDCPLTHVGLLQALLVGEAMKSNGVQIHHVYCSPALRCIETCTNILKGLGIASQMPLNLEPGLFEWLAWYQDGMPEWLTVEELKQEGFNINENYEPFISKEDLSDTHESCEQFYSRSFFVTQGVLKNIKKQGGTVLLVGHAASLDTCSRQLLGGQPRSTYDMTNIIRKVPYCSVSYLVEASSGKWRIEEPMFPPVTHSGNMHFDWKVLL